MTARRPDAAKTRKGGGRGVSESLRARGGTKRRGSGDQIRGSGSFGSAGFLAQANRAGGRIPRRRLLPAALAALVFFAFCLLASAPARAFAEEVGVPALTRAILVPPAAEFSKADRTDGVPYTLYAPPDVVLIYYGAPDADKNNMTRLTVSDGDKGVIYRGETANRFEIRVRFTTDLEVRMHTALTEEDSNSKGSEVFRGEQYFRKRIDGANPKLVKNSLRPSLKDNVWTLAFTAEDPDDDGQYFWARSGLRSVRIVKKYYPDADSDPVYETAKSPGGTDLSVIYEGAGDGKTPTVRANFEFSLKNERGDYYAELTDQVGNFARVSVLNVKEESEQYFEAITFAAKYAGDEALNPTLRSAVSETLGDFLEALNRGATGEPFNAVYFPFLKAMREANEAYEKGVNVVVSIVNGEYLPGTLDADFTAEHYGGKVLYGDTLELRLTVAAFDWERYFNPAAAALAGAEHPTDVLRIQAEILYNGRAVPLVKTVEIYLTVPENDRILALTATSADKTETEKIDYQAGNAWLTFELGAAGAYDLFYRKNENNLKYLWFLLLLLPLGGAFAFVFLKKKRRSKTRGKGVGAPGVANDGTSGGEDGGTSAAPEQSANGNASGAGAEPARKAVAGKTSSARKKSFGEKGAGSKRRGAEAAGAGAYGDTETTGAGADGSRGTEPTRSAADGSKSNGAGTGQAGAGGEGKNAPAGDGSKFAGTAKPAGTAKSSGGAKKKNYPGASAKRKPKKKR